MTDRIGRRDFLRQGALLSAGSLAAGCAQTAATRRTSVSRRERPNFLFILIDDHNWKALGCAGHPFLTTPNIDRLAREGVRFENAFVTTSLCAPSRASFLTGTHAHTHGVIDNEQYRDPVGNIPSLGQLFQAAGYETAFIGKWHMGTFWDPGPRPGFDYWLSFPNQGEYLDPLVNENGNDYRAKGYMTDLLTDWAVKWLERERRAPFCLCLFHKAAHASFIPAERHKDAFPDAELPEPPNYQEDFAGKPEWLRRLRIYGGRRGKWAAGIGKPVPERLEPPEPWDPRDGQRLNYYRTLLAVDDSVGKLLTTLEKLGRLDDTVIVFAGDNGFFLGAHRLGDKRLMYEESIRIPLLVRYPRRLRPGTTVQGMALNIDVAPTLLDLAGAPIPGHIQGKSLVPMMEGKQARLRDSWFYAYFREEWLPGVPYMHGVRTETWKYIRYPDIEEEIDELYDLANDPYELRNLSQDPEYAERKQELIRELERLLVETHYPVGPERIGAFAPLKG